MKKILIVLITAFFALAAGAQEAVSVKYVNVFSTMPYAQANRLFDPIRKQLAESVPELVVLNSAPSSSVPSSIAVDHLSKGQLQIMWSARTVLSPKDFAHHLLSSPPIVNSEEFMAWRTIPQVQAVADQMDSGLNIKAIPCALVDGNMEFVLRRKPDDQYRLQGAKISIYAPYGEMFQPLGIHPAGIPFSEVSSALEKGLIDGAWVHTPFESIEMKLHTSVQALIYPARIRQFFVIDLMFNLPYWNSLTPVSRRAVQTVCTKALLASKKLTKEMADLAANKYKEANVLVAQLSDEQTNLVAQQWKQMAEKRLPFEPNFKFLYESLYRK